MQSGKWSGGCLCGAVRYEATSAPIRVGYCHCRMCQRGLGNVFGTASLFRHDWFRLLLASRVGVNQANSPNAVSAPRCGSPIAYQHSDNQHIAIWVGTLDDPESIKPQTHWHAE